MEFVTALRGGSSSTTFDEGKPSLFELLSEQQLSSLLPPTLRYLLTVATQRYPRRLLRILNSFDELYAAAQLIVERHYLRTRGGSFTEHFYGLKRERSLAAAEIPRASAAAPSVVRDSLLLHGSSDIWKNLLVLVGIPYVKRKLDEAYEIDAPRAQLLGTAYSRPPPPPSDAGWVAHARHRIQSYARWFLRNVYPSVNAAYYFAILAFNLAYLFDRSKYHNPFLWLIGTRVRRMNGADYRALEELANKKPAGAGRGGAPPGGSWASPRNLGRRALGGLSLVLPTSIFALKFLEWWYASDFAKQLSRRAAEALDLPPPVIPGHEPSGTTAGVVKGGKKTGKKGERGEEEGGEEEKEETEEEMKERAPIATPSMLPIYTVPAPESSDVCPICEDEINTPTACQTGIVYCYTCIHKWVTGTHPRQERFMAEGGGSEKGGREGRWESGAGRCAVTGRRLLGGTDGLRRIMV
ncbi:putative pex2 pex12 amino terminal region protein [Diplogelasinospora grovesii]|uniref:Peroxisome assembly protein 12 n=1 Tax=Diplogelasinospora grovesii TaxID=303347 RepID=A0AAN6NHH7_9PEZI|nr:putative pex2 pex12 amino terminal region protein [Diplogelasinospora grovesii]